MSAVVKRSVHGERKYDAPSLNTRPERCDTPEWHRLRLFGSGRHPGAFVAGSEKRAQLGLGPQTRL